MYGKVYVSIFAQVCVSGYVCVMVVVFFVTEDFGGVGVFVGRYLIIYPLFRAFKIISIDSAL